MCTKICLRTSLPPGYVGLEVSPPGYVSINEKLSPISLFSILEATFLQQKNSCQFSQFSRKFTLSQENWSQNEFGGILKSYSMGLWQSMESYVLFHKLAYRRPLFWLKIVPVNSPSFPGKFYIVPAKIGARMNLVRFWSLTPWLCGNKWKIKSYSTNLYIRGYRCDLKQFLPILAVFQENVHCVQTFVSRWVFPWLCGTWSLSPWLCINQWKLCPISRISILEATFLQQKNSCHFSQFSRKIYIVPGKLVPKWVWWDFEVLLPGYVAINGKLNLIPQISTQEATILA